MDKKDNNFLKITHSFTCAHQQKEASKDNPVHFTTVAAEKSPTTLTYLYDPCDECLRTALANALMSLKTMIKNKAIFKENPDGK